MDKHAFDISPNGHGENSPILLTDPMTQSVELWANDSTGAGVHYATVHPGGRLEILDQAVWDAEQARPR